MESHQKTVTALRAAVSTSIAFTALFLTGLQPALAGMEMPCPKMEYARLKDMSRKELMSEFCAAKDKADLNFKLQKISDDEYDRTMSRSARNSSEARGDARVSCIAHQEEVARMLKKKFKAPEPNCP
jgi:hypothetical protein